MPLRTTFETPKTHRMKPQFIRDLNEKSIVSSSFLIKFSALAIGKTGKPYLNLVLCDATGETETRIWDDANQYVGQAVQDAFVWVEGKCQEYQGRLQIIVKSLRVLREDEVNTKYYFKELPLDPQGLYQVLVERSDRCEDIYYRALAHSLLRDDPEIQERLKRAPAAKSMHHAYRAGLIEHIVSIVSTLDFLADHYAPYLDRDLLFLGGVLHDIAKIWELSYDRATEYTNEGRLVGHLTMGVELVERKIQQLEAEPGRLPGPFPVEKKLLVKHVILAHHGELEYGSPKRPKCLEALVVHAIDDLDSKVNAIRCFIEQDMNPGRWTVLNKNFNRYFYKPDWAVELQNQKRGGTSCSSTN